MTCGLAVTIPSQAQASSAYSQQIVNTVDLASANGSQASKTALQGVSYKNAASIMLAADSPAKNPAQLSSNVIESNGLLFTILDDSTRTAAFVGWTGVAPKGTLSVPPTIQVNDELYRVTTVLASLIHDQANSSAPATANAYAQALVDANLSDAAAYMLRANAVAAGIVAPEVTALALPISVDYVDPAALLAYPNIDTLVVDDSNPVLISNGTTIYTNTGTLVCAAPGVVGQIEIAAKVMNVPAGLFAFSKSATSIRLESTLDPTRAQEDIDEYLNQAVFVDDLIQSTDSFAVYGGILYSSDMTTLLAAPAGIGVAAAIHPSCTTIAEAAFYGCGNLQTLSVLGNVTSIANGSFDASNQSASNGFIDSVARFFTGNPTIQVPAFNKNAVGGMSIVLASGQQSSAAEAWLEAGFTRVSTVDTTGITTTPDTTGQVSVIAGDVSLDGNASSKNPEASTPEGEEPSDAIDVGATLTEDPKDGEELLPVLKGAEIADGTFSYTVLDDLSLSVGWEGEQPEGVLEIPASAKLDGITYRVSSIEPGAFAGFNGISGAVIPCTITKIGEGAFENASELQFVRLNEGLSVIESRAFAGTSLKQIDIPASVILVEDLAFDGLDGTLVVTHSNMIQADDVFGNSTNISLYVPFSDSGEYAIQTKEGAKTCATYRYNLQFADSAFTAQAGTPTQLFAEGGVLAEGNADITFETSASQADETSLEDSNVVVDPITYTATSNDAYHGTITATISVALPYPQMNDGVIATSIELASGSVLLNVSAPEAIDEDAVEQDEEEQIEESLPVQQFSANDDQPIEQYADAGEGVNYITLKTGPLLGGHFKRSASASTSSNSACTAVYFGKKSDYASTVASAINTYNADEGNTGTAKVYLVGTTSSFKAYVLSENGLPLRLNKDCSNMFYNQRSLNTISVSNVDNSIAENWTQAFYVTTSLKTVPLSSLLGPNTKTLYRMFYYTSSTYSALTTLDPNTFNGLNNIEDASQAFYNCRSLNSAINFTNCTIANASGMFQSCTVLNSPITLANFNADNATNMFSGCTGLKQTITITDCNITTATNMFSGCTANNAAPTVTNLDTTTMSGMFYNNKFTTATIKLADPTKPVTANTVFSGCTALSSVTLTNFCFGTFTDMFASNSALRTITMNNCQAANAAAMFAGAKTAVYYLYLNDCDFGGTGSWLKAYTALIGVYFTNVTFADGTSLLYGCTNLATVQFNNVSVQTADNMFYNDAKLTSVTITGGGITGLPTSGAPTVSTYRMFYGCSTMTAVTFNNFDVSKVTNFSYMFQGCTAFTTFNRTGFVTSSATNMNYMFTGCTALKTVFLDTFDTSSRPTLSYMHQNNTGLTSVAINDLNTPDATYLFTGCTNVTTASVRFNDACTSINITYMFNGCTKLTSVTFDNLIATSFSGTFTGTAVNTLTIKNSTLSGVSTLLANIKTVIATLNLENVVLETGASVFKSITSLVTINFKNVSFMTGASCNSMFNGCTSLKNVNFENFDTSNISDMTSMFQSTSALNIAFNLNWLDYSSYPNMTSMFQASAITSLVALDPGIKTTLMTNAFRECKSLQSIHLRSADPNTTITMNSTFFNDTAMTTAILEDFNAYSAGGNGSSTFMGCTNLNTLTLKNLETSSLRGIADTYYYSNGVITKRGLIKNLRIEGLKTTGSTAGTFDGFVGMQTCYISNATISSVTKFFNGCSVLTDVTLNEVTITGLDGAIVDGFPSMFSACPMLARVTFDGVYPYGLTSLQSMFEGCTTLTDVVLKKFDTSKVTTMAKMFYGCSNLANIDMTQISCDAIPNFNSMFYNCAKLASIDLHDLRASDCTKMFFGCNALKTANLTNFQGTTLDSMFLSDKALTTVYIDGLVATTTISMFEGCTGLTATSDNGFDFSNVTSTNMTKMFNGCTGIAGPLKITGLKTENATNMFLGCINITSVDLNGGKKESTTIMNAMFSGCSKITTAHVDNFTATAGNTTSSMFASCNAMDSITMTNMSTSTIGRLCGTYGSVTNYGIAKTILIKDCDITSGSSSFSAYSSTTSITFENVTIDEVTSLFNACTAMKTVTLKNVTMTGSRTDTGFAAVAGFPSMFNGCTSLETVIFDGVRANRLQNLNQMFNGCTTLKTVSFNDFDVSNVTDMTSMFNGCTSLSSFDMGLLDFSNAPVMTTMFRDCTSLTNIDFRNLNSVNMTQMFMGCTNLVTINLEGINSPTITTMSGMFNGCKALVAARIANFTASSGSNANSVFTNCTNKNLVITWENIKTTTLKYLCSTYGADTNSQHGWAKEVILKNVNATGSGSAFSAYTLTSKFTFDRVVLDSVDSLFSGDTNLVEVSLRNVTITGVYDGSTGKYSKVAGFKSMFNTCTALERVYFNGVYPNGLDDLAQMFQNCVSLTDISFIKFDTSQVTNMSLMFDGCTSLRNIDMTAMDFSARPNMTTMFRGCTALESIDLSGIAASTSHQMFINCTALKSIDLTRFNCPTMTNMYENCSALTDIIMDGVLAGTTQNMFKNCKGLKAIDLRDVTATTTMTLMFIDCSNLSSIKLTRFKSPVMTNMFQNCCTTAGLVGNADLTDIEAANASYMFNGCTRLVTVNVNGIESTNTTYMFQNCSALTTAYVKGTNRTVATSMTRMFINCTALTDVTLDTFLGVTGTTYAYYAVFSACRSIQNLTIKNFTTTNSPRFIFSTYDDGNKVYGYARNIRIEGFTGTTATTAIFDSFTNLTTFSADNLSLGSFSKLFNNCGNLTTAKFSYTDMSRVTTMGYMFSGCSSLTSYDFGTMNTNKITNMEYMFQNCTSMQSYDFENFDTSNVTTMRGMFLGNTKWDSYDDLVYFNTPKLTSMNYMFQNCTALPQLDLSSFVTTSSPSLTSAWNGCNHLTTIYVSTNWKYNPNHGTAFTNCTRLVGQNGTAYNSNNVSGTYARVDVPGTIGYFTLIYRSAVNGITLNAAIKGLTGNSYNVPDTSVEYIYFGTSEQYEEEIENRPYVKVDTEGKGTVRLYRSRDGASVYVICDTDLKFNADSSYTFSYLRALKGIHFGDIDASPVTNMSYMFNNCTDLTELDISNWTTPVLANTAYMFYNCSSLTTVEASALWNTAKVGTYTNMFQGSMKLRGDNGTVMVNSPSYYNSKEYARLDIPNQPGFFSQKKYTLVDGRTFNATLKKSTYDANSSRPRNIYFGSTADYASIASGYAGVPIDDKGEGTITLYNPSSYVYYILSDHGIQANQDCSYMFYNMRSLAILSFKNFYTDKTTNMSYMFASARTYSSQNYSLDATMFNTSNVTNMTHIFENMMYCPSIKVQNWDTSKVVDMECAFAGALYSQNTLDISGWTFESCVTTRQMFYGRSLYSSSYSYTAYNTRTTTITFGTKETGSKIEDMYGMFQEMRNLRTLDLRSFDTSAVKNMGYMFYNCFSMTDCDVSNMKGSNVTNTSFMFWTCKALKKAELSKFNTPKNTTTERMFYNCNAITSINLSVFGTKNLTNAAYMFYNCSVLPTLDLSSFDTPVLLNTANMFRNCSKLTTIYVSNAWNMDRVATHDSMFSGDTQLKGGNGTHCSVTFRVYNKTYAVIDTSTQKGYLTAAAFTLADGEKVNAAIKDAATFTGSDGTVREIIIGYTNDFDSEIAGLDPRPVDNLGAGTINLYRSRDGQTVYILSYSDILSSPDCSHMFYNLQAVQSIQFINFTTPNMTNSSHMFAECRSLLELNMAEFSTRKVSNMSNMFEGCSKITTMYAGSGWVTTGVTTPAGGANMFARCSDELIGGAGTVWDSANISPTYARVDRAGRPGYFTQITYNLKIGTEMAKLIKNSSSHTTSNSVVTKIIFDYYENWESSITGLSALAVDEMGQGNIELYRSNDKTTVYILSQCGINANVDASYMFYNMRTVSSIQFNNFGTRNTNNMYYMFMNDYALTSLDLATFTTNKVTNFQRMFSGANKLKSINLSSFITSEAIDFSYMFYNCTALQALDVSRFGSPRVTNMAYMFYGLTGVTVLDLSGFTTSRCTNTAAMFYNMTALRTIYANDGWVTDSITSSSNMFYSCSKLVGGNGTKWVSSKRDKTYARVDEDGIPGYFTYKCLSLLPGPELNAIMKNSYSYSETNTTIDRIVFGTPSDYPKVLSIPDRENVDNTRAGIMVMYRQVTHSTGSDGSPEDHVTIYILSDATINANINSSYLFYDMRNLTEIVYENWSTQYVDDMSYMFAYDEKLTDVDISTFDSIKTTKMPYMFYNCKSLETLDFSRLDTSKVNTMGSMLRNCSSLTTVYAGSTWSTSSVTSSASMFTGCTEIRGGNGTSYNASYVDAGRAKIDIPGTAGYFTMVTYNLAEGTVVNAVMKNSLYSTVNNKITRVVFGYTVNYESSIAGLKGTPVDERNDGSIMLYRSTDGTVIYILSPCAIAANENSSYLFSNLEAVTSFTMSNFSSAKATNLSHLFEGDKALTSPPASYLNTTGATDLSYMFQDCTALTGVNLTPFKVETIETMEGMFKGCTSLSSVNTTNWKTESLTNMSSFFENCTTLRSFNISKLNLTKVTNMARFFSGCTNFVTFTSRGVNTPELQNMNSMFNNCTSLTWLDLSDFDTRKTTDMAYTWYNCNKLVTILASGRWDNQNVVNMDFTFYLCTKIRGGAGTTYDITRTSAEYAKIDKEDDPGYLTVGTVYLIAGPELNEEITDSTGTVRTVTFGLAVDYAEKIIGLKATPVDEDRTGTINMYASAGNVYILSDFYINTPNDASGIFDGMISLETINFQNFETTTSKSFANMFRNCASLKSLDLSGFNTRAATDMSGLLDGCVGLSSVDVSTFDTTSVTSMARMFAGCSSIKELDISSLSTERVADMSYMFSGDTSLKTITGGASWSTGAVVTSTNMFADCSSVVGGNGTTFDASYVDAERAIFDRNGRPGYLSMVRYALLPGKELNAAIKEATYTTADYTIANITFGYLDENQSVANGRSWVAVDAKREGTIRLYKTNPSSVYVLCATDIMADEHASYMFSDMRRLENLTFDNFNTTPVTDMSYMFNYCYRISTLNLSKFDTSSVTNFSYMFSNMYTTNYGLKNLNISSFDTSKATTMEYMFCNDQALTALDVSRFDTSEVTSMACMFQGVGAQILDVSNFDTSKVETMYFMFYNASNVRALDVSNFNTSNVIDMRSMFRGCTSLGSLDVHTFDTSNVTSMYYMFRDCKSLTELNVLNIDTSKVNDLSYLFYGCSAIEMIDLSTFDTYAVTNMSYMFYGCSKLKTMYAGRLWSIGKVSSSVNMFTDCVNVVGECGTTYDPMKIDKVYGIIDTLEKPGYLTLKGYKLLPGKELAAELKGAAFDASNSEVSKIIFAYNQDYPELAKDNGVAVDLQRLGYVQMHRATEDGKTVLYVLSDCEIRANTDSSYSFNAMTGLKDVDFSNYNATYGENYSFMFANCTGMENLVMEGFDTLNATSLGSMYEGCTSLKTLDLSDFNTQYVTDTTKMFNNDGALTTVIVGGGWDVTKTPSTIGMFTGCNNIVGAVGTTYNSGHTNGEYARIDDAPTTPGYLTMTYYTLMDGDKFNEAIKGQKFSFYDDKIESVIFGFASAYPNITSTVRSTPVDMEEKGKIRAYPAENAGSGTKTVYVLSTCGIQTSADPSFMFYRTEKLANIQLNNFKSPLAEDMTSMFGGCEALKSFDLSVLDMSNVTNAHSMFADDIALTNITLAGNNATSLEDISEMFAGCTSLTSMSLAGLNTSKVDNMAGLFTGCAKLTSASLGGADTSKVTSFENMFEGCESLTDPGLAGINMTSATDVSSMFANCTSLTSFDLSVMNTSGVLLFDNMFEGCSNLVNLDATKLNTSSARSLSHLFSGCSKLPAIDLSNMNTTNVTNMAYMFYECAALTELNVKPLDVSGVVNMEGMFGEMANITVLDLSSFVTNKVTNMSYMFTNDPVLKTIYAGKYWSTASVTQSTNMFLGCEEVVGGNGTIYNKARVNAKYAVIDTLTTIGYLTVITYTLLPGPELNAAIKATADYTTSNSTIKKIVFGYIEDYASSVSGTPVAVDANKTGDIKMYRSADGATIHILCDYGIRLNANSSYAFSTLSGITSYVFENLDASTGLNMSNMFAGNSSLTSLDITDFTTFLATNMSNMFYGNSKLSNIYVGDNWGAQLALDSEAGGTSAGMFTGCTALAGGHGTSVSEMQSYDATFALIDDKHGSVGTEGYLTGKTIAARFLNDQLPSYTNEDGEVVTTPKEVLQTVVMNVGATPAYTKATPESVNEPGLGKQYVFKGWTPTVGARNGYIEYTAVYDLETCPVYTITLDPNGGTVSEVYDEETDTTTYPVTTLYYWKNAGYTLIPNPQSEEDLIAAGDWVTEIVPQWLGHDFDGFGPTSLDKYITIAGKLSKTAPEVTQSQTWYANWLQATIGGEVIIDNMTPVFGDLLTANVINLQSAAQAHYQWYRDDDPVLGAVSSQYYLLPADVGHQMKCVVTDENGYFGGSIASEFTAEVDKAQWTDLKAEIDGNPAVGDRLTVKLIDAPKYGTLVLSYKWYRDGAEILGSIYPFYNVPPEDMGHNISCVITPNSTCYYVNTPTIEPVLIEAGKFDATVTLSTYDPIAGEPVTATITNQSDGSIPNKFTWYRMTEDGEVVIEGANGQSYTPTSEDIGCPIVCAVEDTSGYYTGEARSPESNPVRKAIWEDMTADLVGTPGLADVCAIGQASTAITDNAPDGATFTYEWYLDGSLIEGETSSTYTPGFADFGHMVTAIVIAENDTHQSLPAQTPGYIVGKGFLQGDAELNPAVPKFWEPTSVTINSLSEGAEATYQWYRRTAEGDTPIMGETDSTYRANRDDIGNIVVAKISDRAGYYIGEVEAVATGIVEAPQTMPVVLTSNEFVVSESVTATVTPPTGTDAATLYTYVWEAAEDPTTGPWSVVSSTKDLNSLTNRLYMAPTVRDKYLRVTVYAPGLMGDVVSDTPVGSKVLNGKITLDNTAPKYGDTITATATDYQDDILPVLTWYRDDSTEPIGTGTTYTVGVADVGHAITCALTDGNEIRSGDVSATTDPVVKLPWKSMKVAIDVLTADDSDGTIKLGKTIKAVVSDKPEDIADINYHPGDFSYQWFADGVAIADPRGTSQTLVLEPDEYKKTVTVVAAVANNSCYEFDAATSLGGLAVQGDLAGTVTITGTNSVGSSIYANLTNLSKGAVPTYQWLRDGVAVPGATGDSYLLTNDDLECQISVEVTDSSNGDEHYYVGSITSSPTHKIGKNVTITWNAGDGVFSDGTNLITNTVVYAKDAVWAHTDLPETPTREGYILGGWRDKDDATGNLLLIGVDGCPENDTVYYAEWIEAVNVDVPVSLSFTIQSSGFATTERGAITSHMAGSVGIIRFEAISDSAGFPKLFTDAATSDVAITVTKPGYTAANVPLDRGMQVIDPVTSGLTISANETVNLDYGLTVQDVTKVDFSLDSPVKFADLIYTIAPSSYFMSS